MTLQASGAISFSDLQTEFGGDNPIGLNEYYKDGTYVPSALGGDGTVSDYSYTESNNGPSGYGGGSIFWRYYENGSGSIPVYNSSGNYMMYYSYWTDQAWTSGTGWVDHTMTADLSGTYQLEWSAYNTGASRSRQVWVNGSSVHTSTSTSGSATFTAEAGDTIRIYSSMTTIGNYNSHTIYLKAEGGGTTLEVPANENIPTSGVLSMDDFYSGQGN